MPPKQKKIISQRLSKREQIATELLKTILGNENLRMHIVEDACKKNMPVGDAFALEAIYHTDKLLELLNR